MELNSPRLILLREEIRVINTLDRVDRPQEYSFIELALVSVLCLWHFYHIIRRYIKLNLLLIEQFPCANIPSNEQIRLGQDGELIIESARCNDLIARRHTQKRDGVPMQQRYDFDLVHSLLKSQPDVSSVKVDLPGAADRRIRHKVRIRLAFKETLCLVEPQTALSVFVRCGEGVDESVVEEVHPADVLVVDRRHFFLLHVPDVEVLVVRQTDFLAAVDREHAVDSHHRCDVVTRNLLHLLYLHELRVYFVR